MKYKDNEEHPKRYRKMYMYQSKLFARKARIHKWKMKEPPALYKTEYTERMPSYEWYTKEKIFPYKIVSKRSKDKKRKYQWIEQLVWNFPEIKRLEGGRGPVKSLVSSNEKGIQMKNRHAHLYLEMKKSEVEIKRFRNYFIRRCRLLIDIKTCKKN